MRTKIGYSTARAIALVAVLVLAVPCAYKISNARAKQPTKSPQDVHVDIPRNLNNPDSDPELLKESAVIISIPNSDQAYVGAKPVVKDDLGSRISELLNRQPEPDKIVYIAAGASVDYGAVVRVIDIIRNQKVNKIGLIAGRKLMSDEESRSSYPPTRFLIEVPRMIDADEEIINLKPNPLTLVASISLDLKIKLNNYDRPHRDEPCYRLVSSYGSANDADPLAKCLKLLFKRRSEPQRAYRPGFETRTDLPLAERIEKTIFVKAPLSIKYGDVIRVIDAIKGAGGNPIGLQIDDLPQ